STSGFHLQYCPSLHATSIFSSLFDSTSPTDISTLSLHDALPILLPRIDRGLFRFPAIARKPADAVWAGGLPRAVPRCADGAGQRSEEHTSELQSRGHLVCRLLLEKKKKKKTLLTYRYQSKTHPEY